MPETVRNPREVFRDAFLMQERIAALLREEPRTIPSLAAALQAPTREVLVWVMAMWRYGLVRELPKDRSDAYHKYAPAK